MIQSALSKNIKIILLTPSPDQRVDVQRTIGHAFVSAFRLVMLGAAALALAAAAVGAAIR